MLKEIKVSGVKKTNGRFAIVASKYNARYVDAMLRAATAILKKAGAKEIQVIRVPGAFEIPVVVSKLASVSPAPSAIICLGVILRGATTHAQVVSEVVSQQLGDIAVRKRGWREACGLPAVRAPRAVLSLHEPRRRFSAACGAR